MNMASEHESGIKATFTKIIGQVGAELSLNEYWESKMSRRFCAETVDMLARDLKGIGSFLRVAAGIIKTKHDEIPEHIVKYAEDVDLLRGIADNVTYDDVEDE